MSEYFPEAIFFGRTVKVELDVSNYATKADFKIQQILVHQNLLKRMI